MSIPFQLGDRVKVSATLVREYGDTPGTGHIATWRKSPLWEPCEGVIMGYRTAVDGCIESDVEYGEYGHILSQSTIFVTTPGSAQRYWLVVTHPRKNPLKVPEDAIEILEDDSGVST